jgi:hypothetical protein
VAIGISVEHLSELVFEVHCDRTARSCKCVARDWCSEVL